MKQLPKAPARYEQFVARYPKLRRAWETIAEAGADGPLDRKTARLVKLGIAIGALRQGAVHAGVRKGLAEGLSIEEIEQTVALAAGTLGLPSSVAAFSWISDELEKQRQWELVGAVATRSSEERQKR